MSVVEKRSHGRSPWRDAFEMIATRPQRATADSIELGQSAAGLSYVKSLHVTRDEDEGWAPFLDRATAMLAYAVERLPQAPVSPSKPLDGEKDPAVKAAAIASAQARRRP